MKDARQILDTGLKELGISCTEKQISDLLFYLTELKKWSRAYNLTGLKTDRDIVIRHFLDSLLFLKVLPPKASSVADIGSGAGFPGVPMKIMRTDLKMILIEPVRKKALFLEHIRGALGISGIEVLNTRIEDVAGIQVDAAVTRALFSIRDFAVKADRLLENDGVLILSKGPKLDQELKDIDTALIRVDDIVLPFEKTIRHLVVIQKMGPSK
jgi:16S rRNA (guanine527-N7)-methyltransferase